MKKLSILVFIASIPLLTGCAGLSVKAVAPGASLSAPVGSYYIQGILVGPTATVTNVPGPALVATGVTL
jgi:hypothetical protein